MIYFEAIICSLLPFILIILINFCWMMYYLVKRKIEIDYKEKLLSTFVIIIFWLQPIILKSLFNIISCRMIDKSYMQSDLTVECFTNEHITWIYRLFIPSFSFYGIILPIAALSYMMAYSNDLYLGKHARIVGFLSNGYRSKKFYWEFIFFYRKFAIIFIAQFFVWKIESKTLLVLMIIFLSLWQQTRDHPFISDDLNSLDFKATIFSFYTLFLGLFSYEFPDSPIGVFIVILIFFFNIAFIIIWMRRILMLNAKIFYSPAVSKYFTWMFPYLERIQEEYNHIEREASKSMSSKKNVKSNFGVARDEKKKSFFQSLRTGMRMSKLIIEKNENELSRNKSREQSKALELCEIDLNEEKNHKNSVFAFENNGIDIIQEENPDQSSSRLNKDHVIEVELNNKSSFGYLSKKEKKNTFDDSDDFSNLLALKDEHIASLYAEIRDLKQEIQDQKKELEFLRRKLKKASPPNFKEIRNMNLINKQEYLRTSEPETGFFLEKIEIGESSLFETFTKRLEFEVLASHFTFTISQQNNNSKKFATKFSIAIKGLKETTFFHDVNLKPSKNVLLSKKIFEGFFGEKKIVFALEKIIRLESELKNYLIVDIILTNENSQHKIEIKLPIENWLFFLNFQEFEEFNFGNETEIILEKKLIGQFLNEILRRIGFRESYSRKSLFAVISLNIEGENINIIIEYRDSGLFNVLSWKLDEKFHTFMRKWVEEEFFTKFLERLPN